MQRHHISLPACTFRFSLHGNWDRAGRGSTTPPWSKALTQLVLAWVLWTENPSPRQRMHSQAAQCLCCLPKASKWRFCNPKAVYPTARKSLIFASAAISLEFFCLSRQSSTHSFAATQVLVPHLSANYDYSMWTVCSLVAVDLFILGNLKVWDVHSMLARFPYIRHENKAPSSKKIYFKYFFAVEKKRSSLLLGCERKPFPSPSTRSILHLC